MRVYMLRHGQAASRAGYESDADRPLTDEGAEAMRREAVVIKALVQAVDAIVTSPYPRARQTAEIVAQALGATDHVLVDKRLAPGFSITEFEAVVREHEPDGAIMLVGHEPDFSETLSDAIGGGRLVMKKAGLARIDLPDHSVRRGELVWLAPPAVLLGA